MIRTIRILMLALAVAGAVPLSARNIEPQIIRPVPNTDENPDENGQKAVQYPVVRSKEPVQNNPKPSSHDRYSAKKAVFNQPVVAVKVNLLYGGTLTPNLRLDIGLGAHTSLEVGGSWNPWKTHDGKRFEHWLAGAEFRYWLCARHSGHFFGIHPFYVDYDITGYKIPQLFDKEIRYDGTAMGGGITYGYHLMLGRHWGLEFHVGAGVAQMKYTKYQTEDGEEISAGEFKTTYIGPTRAGISAVFLF